MSSKTAGFTSMSPSCGAYILVESRPAGVIGFECVQITKRFTGFDQHCFPVSGDVMAPNELFAYNNNIITHLRAAGTCYDLYYSNRHTSDNVIVVCVHVYMCIVNRSDRRTRRVNFCYLYNTHRYRVVTYLRRGRELVIYMIKTLLHPILIDVHYVLFLYC